MILLLRGSLFAVLLLLGMVALVELGRRLGAHRRATGGGTGLGAIEGGVFALMGLLIAFTFSGAAERFERRRQLILDEANALSTAWQYLEVMPPASQPELRDLLRRYVDSRLAVYAKLPDYSAAQAEMARANELQSALWSRAILATRGVDGTTPFTAQAIAALSRTFDISAARVAALETHPPRLIFWVLGILTLVSALLGGFSMGAAHTRSWLHMLGFALIMAGTVYLILDFEFPRIGLIRIDEADRYIQQVRQGMQ